MEIFNRKAKHDYSILSEIEAGIELFGTEIKSIRKGNANISDSFGRVKNSEVYLTNMFIARYEEGNRFNHEERRERRLLLHKKEILKLDDSIKKNNYTLIPLKLYIKNGKAKILLGLCKGKKTFDKRQALKEKDIKRREYINIK